MGPIHVMVFFLLGLSHSSLAKVCPGCSKYIDTQDQTAFQYLSDKLKNLKNVSPLGMENENEAELVRILNAKKQVVSGIQYFYEFEAKGLSSNKLYNCNLIVVRQEWKGTEKVIEYKCHVLSSNKNRRSVLGGEVELEVANNGKLEQLKSFIGQEIGKSLNSQYLMKVTKFFKATEQVVAGLLIKTTVEVANTNCLQNQVSNNCQIQQENHQVCDVKVWMKPGSEGQEVTSIQCRQQPKFCAGCPFETDISNAFVQQCLKRTLSNLNAQSHDSQKLALVKINKVISQVVAGMKYTVEFDANEKSSNSVYSCKTVILSQPWISEEPVVLDFDCTPNSSN